MRNVCVAAQLFVLAMSLLTATKAPLGVWALVFAAHLMLALTVTPAALFIGGLTIEDIEQPRWLFELVWAACVSLVMAVWSFVVMALVGFIY